MLALSRNCVETFIMEIFHLLLVSPEILLTKQFYKGF